MTTDFSTPEKDLADLIKEAPQTVQRTQNECIFSSEHKKTQSRASQRRYTNIRQSQALDEILADKIIDENLIVQEGLIDFKSGKFLNYAEETSPQPPPNHSRKNSHRRSSSICVLMGVPDDQVLKEITQQVANAPGQATAIDENKLFVKNQSPISTGSCHGRNLSDCDSVIYLGHGEEPSREKENTFIDSLEQTDELKSNFHKKAPTAFTACTAKTEKYDSIASEAGKFPEKSFMRGSLPIFGNMPCTAYCHFCKEVVHTTLDFNAKIPRPLIKVFSTITSCCRVPEWLDKLRMHRCPKCALVLAKSR
ncbi:unnamed protein product [Blepharisma stoltei]|uniref:LITAF domain-containing protein n=1 Tax=Blepharisma stoltei TaxID=1481888 RepID=A0AAU9K8V2_9CILI|nr:unnamed protein product [Blepharisma stoltei]